jgi:hypothetical protein
VVSLGDFRSAKGLEAAQSTPTAATIELLDQLLELAKAGHIQGVAVVYDSAGKPRCCIRGTYERQERDGYLAAAQLAAVAMLRARMEED